jgi:hypothetical protein
MRNWAWIRFKLPQPPPQKLGAAEERGLVQIALYTVWYKSQSECSLPTQ